MKDVRLISVENVVPLLAPVDSAGTAYALPYIDLKNALHCTIFIFFGVVTATSVDQPVIVTVEASTAAASNATEVAIAFKYRKAGAVGANTWGAITTATASGITVATTDDGFLYAIDIDPAALPAAHGQDDARFIRGVVGIDAGGTVTLNAAWAVVETRYPQLTHLSTT
jgi:hypothetical protein